VATCGQDKTKAIPGHQNPKCYARELEGCSLQTDGEHYISQAILERIPDRRVIKSKAVLVRNLSFQKQPDLLEAMGIGNLASKMLCKIHNNALSDYDAAFLALYEALDALDDEGREPVSDRSIRVIDGDAFERFMLKAFIGGLYSGNFRLPTGMTMKGEPPTLEMLHILYRGAEFPARTGMFWIPPKPGNPVTSDHMVLQVAPVPSVDNTMVGEFRVILFGFEFTLLMLGLAPSIPSVFDSASFRPAGIRVNGFETEIQFKWKNGPQSEEIVFESSPGE